jgi:hypothetical protein
MNKIYPFKFLDAYSKNDTGMFFGRTEEIDALYQMIFQTNILMIYGASGTGKTSIINCGLASKFQPHDWFALDIRRGNDLNESLAKALADAGGGGHDADEIDFAHLMADEPDIKTATKKLSPLAKSLKAAYLNYFRPVYLIFDQFEELFIIGSKKEQAKFIETVQEILKAEQPVKMIFSIREEYLGYLYDFEKAVPQLMRKKLRVEPMNLDKVRQVIHGVTTFPGSNISIKKGQEQQITEKIFDKIKGGDKTLTIQLPYLQVFLDKLYVVTTNDQTRQQDAEFTIDAIMKLGDIGDVLRDLLEEQAKAVSEKISSAGTPLTTEQIWKILAPFTTLEGTKEPLTMQELCSRLPGINKQLIKDTVEAFVTSRILRFSEDRNVYELAHDTLAGKIAAKRSDEEIALLEVKRLVKNQASMKADARELFTEKQLNFIEQYADKISLDENERKLIAASNEEINKQKIKKKKRNTAIMVALVCIVAIMGFLTIWAFSKSAEAKEQYNVAKQNEALANNRFEDLKKQQAIAKAKHEEAAGDSYMDIQSTDKALQSYQAALDSLKDYPNDPLYSRLSDKIKKCK